MLMDSESHCTDDSIVITESRDHFTPHVSTHVCQDEIQEVAAHAHVLRLSARIESFASRELSPLIASRNFACVRVRRRAAAGAP